MNEEQSEYVTDKNAPIEIRIDTNHIPAEVGCVSEFGNRDSLKIYSMQGFCAWVNKMLPDTPAEITSFVIAGPLPNCAAVQIGILISGRGDVFFETTRKTRRRVGAV